MSEFEEIKRLSGTEPNACACSTCKDMCSKAPCLATPEDIVKLIDAGYQDRLVPTLWMVGVLMGLGTPIAMVQARTMPNGSCTFLNDQGLCELHDSGLKPTEGKLANCKTTTVPSFLQSANCLVARSWIDDKNQHHIGQILIKMTE